MPELFEAYDDLDDVGERLKAADPAQRRGAIIELGNSGDRAAGALLDPMGSDPHAGGRQQGALALGGVYGPEAAAAPARLLVAPEQALTDRDWMVRETAAECLGSNREGFSAAGALIDALSDEYWQVRLKAARSLGMLKVAQAVPAIGAGLDHPQANLRKECAAALGE